MRTTTNLLVLAGTLIVGVSCDRLDPAGKKHSPTPDEILAGENGDGSETERTSAGDQNRGYEDGDQNKFFRTGTQYIYAVSKTVDITGSALREASDFENIKSKFPTSSDANEENLNSFGSAMTAYAYVASSACGLYLAKDEIKSLPLDEMAAGLAARGFVDQASSDAALEEAMKLAELVDEAAQPTTVCMELVTMANIIF
jgi:hypothetical protein